ncbi:MAG: dihydrolipoamide acetyltransferase family protein [Nitrospiria bacterium]
MKKVFTFPDVGEGIAEGEIVKWLVSKGDVIKEDQPLIDVETDKAVVSLPSPYAGKIIALHGEPGEIIAVGATLVTIETEIAAKKSTPGKGKRKDSGSVVGELETSEKEFILPIHKKPDETASKKQAEREVRAIPSVRIRAKALGVDLDTLQGSGPEGRITREDVEKAARTSGVPPTETAAHGPVERVPFRGVRRSGARHVAQSSEKVAAVTFVDDADITKLERVRLNKKVLAEERGFNLTYLPFVIKSVVAGLKAFPYLNATLDEAKEEILLKKYYNIGIAVDTPDGLMVFVIKDADQKSILDLAQEISTLTEKAFARTIALPELKGGTFTLTNYGVIGGIYGTPIINYPEVGILGLGKIEDRAVVRSGEIVIRKILPLSLTFDHRVIYGSEGARFMNTVIEHLEDPDLMLIEGK